MRGSKTTAIDQVKVIVKVLKKNMITNISYGIIIQVKNRRDHRTTIKLTSESGAHLMSITGKMYKQEFRIYDNVSQKVIKDILKKNLNESFRIL